jgi:hypothetical protein
MHRVVAASLVLTLALAGTPIKSQSDLHERLETLPLPSLPGPVSAFYSRGHEARATLIRDMARGMVGFYREKLGITLEVRVLVLDSTDWRTLLGDSMYGFPRSERPDLAIVPATLPPAYAELERVIVTALPTLPPEVAVELRNLGVGDPGVKDLARFEQDKIVYHELGHLYTHAFGIATPRGWLSELLATYWWNAYTRDVYPALTALEPRIQVLYPPLPPPRHTSLEDFERLYPNIAFENYMWYQQRFGARLNEVLAQRGIRFLADLREALPLGRTEALTDVQLLERLERLSPGWQEWLATFKPL